EDDPATVEYRRNLVEVYRRTALAHQRDGTNDQAAVFYERARALAEATAADDAGAPWSAKALALVYRNLGALKNATDRPDEALAHFRRARALLTELVHTYPGVVDFRY